MATLPLARQKPTRLIRILGALLVFLSCLWGGLQFALANERSVGAASNELERQYPLALENIEVFDSSSNAYPVGFRRKTVPVDFLKGFTLDFVLDHVACAQTSLRYACDILNMDQSSQRGFQWTDGTYYHDAVRRGLSAIISGLAQFGGFFEQASGLKGKNTGEDHGYESGERSHKLIGVSEGRVANERDGVAQILFYLIYGAFYLIGYICYNAGYRVQKHQHIARLLRWSGGGLIVSWCALTAVMLVMALAALP